MGDSTSTPFSSAGAWLRQLFGLEGQVAVVVGGAGRIGSALCEALSLAGAKVAVLDPQQQAAAALADRLTSAGHPSPVCLPCDATDPGQLEQAAKQIARNWEPATILVNAAQFRGDGFYSSSVDHYSLEAWQQTLQVNLTGVFLACQVFGRHMIERGGGSIVNLASTYGLVSPDPRIYGQSGVNSPVSYAASKAGVVQLTRYLAVHWREQQVRVNCLVPGGVFDQQSPEFVEAYCQRTPLGRMATPADYQGPLLMLVSAASRYMTGAVLTVDGGWTAW